MPAQGRLHSLTNGGFREAQIQGSLFGDELGKQSGMSRPKAVIGDSTPHTPYRIGTVLRCALSTITNSRKTNLSVELAFRWA